VHHQTRGSSVAHTSQRLLCREPSRLLGASVGSAQSPPCGLEHQHLLRQCLEIPQLQGDSSTCQTTFNSLGKLPTLRAQPFLIDNSEDCNYVHKVFLGVPTGVYGHVEVGFVWRLDLQGLRFFLGRDNICLRYVRDGPPVAQLPFLALSILQPVGRLEGVVLILACCQSLVLSWSFLKEDFGSTCKNPAA
jgi:hypothetical protein